MASLRLYSNDNEDVELEHLFGDDTEDEPFDPSDVTFGEKWKHAKENIDAIQLREAIKTSHPLTDFGINLRVAKYLHGGADPSVPDEKGNTALHYAAKKGYRGVAVTLIAYGAKHVKNQNNLFPFHLHLDNYQRNLNNHGSPSDMDRIGQYLLLTMNNEDVRSMFLVGDGDDDKVEKKLVLSDWLTGDMKMPHTVSAVLESCSDWRYDRDGPPQQTAIRYEVLQADRSGRVYGQPGFEPEEPSFLHVMADHNISDVTSHVVMRRLIARKWNSFAKAQFTLEMILFFSSLLAMTVALVVAVMTSDPMNYGDDVTDRYSRVNNVTGATDVAVPAAVQVVRAVCEVYAVLAVLVTVAWELYQLTIMKRKYFTNDLFNFIDLTSAMLLLTVVPLRLAGCNEQWIVFALGYAIWTTRSFQYLQAFDPISHFKAIIHQIIVKDLFSFTIIFCVFLLTFSGAYILSLRGEQILTHNPEVSTFWDILLVGLRTLLEGQAVVDYTTADGHEPMSSFIMMVFLFVCCVVLLNILIAQVCATFQAQWEDSVRGKWLNRAQIITRIEKTGFPVFSIKKRTYETSEPCKDLTPNKRFISGPITNQSIYNSVDECRDRVDMLISEMFSLERDMVKRDVMTRENREGVEETKTAIQEQTAEIIKAFKKQNSEIAQLAEDVNAQKRGLAEALAAQKRELVDVVKAQKREITDVLKTQKREFNEYLHAQQSQITDALSAQNTELMEALSGAKEKIVAGETDQETTE